ncbi:hypothetical protein ACFLWS_08370 [Chloroflexota bacterium]
MKKRIVWLLLDSLMVLLLLLASCTSELTTAPTPAAEDKTSDLDSPAPPVLTPEDEPAAPYLTPPIPAQDPNRLVRQYAEVILGKDNWLFWGGPINELIRFGGLDDAQIEKCVTELSYVNDRLKEQGVHLLFVLIPDKELIYPEYMTDVYRKSNIPSSYDGLSQALMLSGIDFIDCKPLMLEKKEEAGNRLYYLRDTRFNPLGNLYVLQEVLNHLSEEYSVPKYDLVSVDTDESRVTESATGNDLNDLLQVLSPWRERGAPKPVYNVDPASQAPPVLWYGSCFSPALIGMLQRDWPNSITHVSFWQDYGLPLSFRQDIDRRLQDNKIVVFEIAEHYRQKLSTMLRPEPPQFDFTPDARVHSWQTASLLQKWENIGRSTLEVENDMVLVEVTASELAPFIRTTESLLLSPDRRYYLEIKLVSPAFTGMMVDFSRALGDKDVWSDGQGRHIYQGENTVVFQIPDRNKYGAVQNIRIHLAQSGIYGISKIAIYSRRK